MSVIINVGKLIRKFGAGVFIFAAKKTRNRIHVNIKHKYKYHISRMVMASYSLHHARTLNGRPVFAFATYDFVCVFRLRQMRAGVSSVRVCVSVCGL